MGLMNRDVGVRRDEKEKNLTHFMPHSFSSSASFSSISGGSW